MLSNISAAVFSVFARGAGLGYFTTDNDDRPQGHFRGRLFPCLFFLKIWKPSGGAGYGYSTLRKRSVVRIHPPPQFGGVAQLVERLNLRGRLFPRFTFLGGVGAGYFFGKYTRLRLFPGIYTFAMAQAADTSWIITPEREEPVRVPARGESRGSLTSAAVSSSRLLLAVAQGADTSLNIGSNPIGCRVARPGCPWPNGKALTGASRRLKKSHLRFRTFPAFFQIS